MGRRVGANVGDLDRLVTDVRKLSKYPQLREIADRRVVAYFDGTQV